LLLILDCLSKVEERKFDDRLLKILEEEVMKERWKKKIKITGIITKKRLTKKGSFVLTIKTKSSEYDVVVPQYKGDLFNSAKNINEGDSIKVIGDKQTNGIIFCDKIGKFSKEYEKQLNLIS